jgi:RND family efflux transporter MFP subunit
LAGENLEFAMRRGLWFAGAAVAVVIVAGGAVGVRLAHGDAQASTPAVSAQPPLPAVPVRVTRVHLRAADQAVRYSAVIKPRIEGDIGFRVGGKLLTRLVDVGATVKDGTPLARLDPADFELQASAIEAQLASAHANAVNARDEFARAELLLKDGWITRQNYDARRATVETAQARVREMEATLKVAKDNARYTTLVASGDGVVTAVLAEPGQVLSQGQAVFRIARLGEMEAVADVPEQDVARLSSAHLTISLWALPGVAIDGKLRELAPSADAATRTYRAKIMLNSPPPGVQLGMTATVNASREEAGSAALLPMTSLTKEGTTPAVWVLNDAKDGLALRPVTIAAYVGDLVAIAGGLKEGEFVVTAGVHKLDAGQKVRVWTEPVR